MDSLRNSSQTEVQSAKCKVQNEPETARPETGDRRRGTSEIADPQSAIRNPQSAISSAAAAAERLCTIPPEAAQERERLSAAVDLLREAFRHLNGAKDHAPSERLSRLSAGLAELETDIGLRVLALGGLVGGETPPRLSAFDAADVSGKIRFGQSLRAGPLAVSLVEVDGAWEIFVTLGDRAEIQIGFNGAGTLDFHALTAGLDYPEVVEAPPAPAGGLSDGSAAPSLRHSVTQSLPLVSIGQGTSTREITEEDVEK